jgi:hypothetical protein
MAQRYQVLSAGAGCGAGVFEEHIRLMAGFPNHGSAFVHFGFSRDHAAIDLKNDFFHFPFYFTVFHDPPPIMGFCHVALL